MDLNIRRNLLYLSIPFKKKKRGYEVPALFFRVSVHDPSDLVLHSVSLPQVTCGDSLLRRHSPVLLHEEADHSAMMEC